MKLQSCIFALVLASCGIGGCKSHQKYIVPDMPTARQQYQLAYESYREAAAYVGQSKQKNESLDKAEAAFQKVIDQFPGDTTFPPLADLMLARCELLRESFKLAVKRYQDVLARYPDNSQVQQIGLFELGRSFDLSGKYAEAKEAYRQFIEKFGKDASLKDDAEAQKRLSDARRYYRIIRTE